jgi:hypothetical protein
MLVLTLDGVDVLGLVLGVGVGTGAGEGVVACIAFASILLKTGVPSPVTASHPVVAGNPMQHPVPTIYITRHDTS